MHEALQLEIHGGCGFAAVARGVREENIFCAAAEARDVPGQVRGFDGVMNAGGETFGERDHVGEGFGGEDVFQGGADGGEREGVAGERAANAAGVAIFELNAFGDFFGDSGGAAVGGGGNSAGDGFADDENIGMESVGASVAAGTGADGVGFVDDEKSAEFFGELRGFFPVARVRVHDADVGEDRFGEDAGDVAMGQFPFEGGQVVEFDNAGGDGGIYRRADIAAARDGGAVGVE